MNPVTLGDLLLIPEISDLRTSKYVLHLKENNIIKIKDKYYECRMFAFDVDNLSLTFREYVDQHELHSVELTNNLDYNFYRVSLLSYSKNTPEEYILISLRDLNLEHRDLAL